MVNPRAYNVRLRSQRIEHSKTTGGIVKSKRCCAVGFNDFRYQGSLLQNTLANREDFITGKSTAGKKQGCRRGDHDDLVELLADGHIDGSGHYWPPLSLGTDTMRAKASNLELIFKCECSTAPGFTSKRTLPFSLTKPIMPPETAKPGVSPITRTEHPLSARNNGSGLPIPAAIYNN